MCLKSRVWQRDRSTSTQGSHKSILQKSLDSQREQSINSVVVYSNLPRTMSLSQLQNVRSRQTLLIRNFDPQSTTSSVVWQNASSFSNRAFRCPTTTRRLPHSKTVVYSPSFANQSKMLFRHSLLMWSLPTQIGSADKFQTGWVQFDCHQVRLPLE